MNLPQIGLQRTRPARLERVHPLKRLEQGLLDKVVGVGQVSRPPGQPAAGPAPEWREVPLEQELKGVGVAGPGAINQMQRRLRITAGRRATL